MRKHHQLLLILLLLITTHSGTPFSYGQIREDELRSDLAAAFEIVSRAEHGGAQVKDLVEELNIALVLIESGRTADLHIAETKIDAIIASASTLETTATTIILFQRLKTAFILGLLIASAIIAKRYGPKVFWTMWLRVMRGWTVHT